MMKRVLLILLLISAGAFGVAPASAGPFDNWAALVVAGDSRAHSGAPSEVFDNARRDLVTALKQMGFAENHIEQFSARPELDPTTKPLHSDAEQIYVNFNKLTQQATAGCFIYFTSHGAPLGIIVGDSMVPIRTISDIVDRTCSNRPTVIIISACFSGMFIPVMHADNRMIFTAARPDRTSFGCGEANQYTFFDQCVLESLPKSPDFPALAVTTKDCVGAREKAEMVEPSSEPQLYVGSAIAPLLPSYKLSGN
ncbi:MAG TPA: C13 family peptidase [Micropepsaceae bacterium]|nr:C13 family peptidase [Micropepsaceae bacterium]